ncbi:peptide alpha-N-acetyltransferase complex B subunit NAT3 [Ascoidea rubescens DSM 1968]|uniref:Acyl-CoA N-acyltransferase n=1 Tax=Ascoidea rubescens DSM 1968 TaxID=1344418 RepID=A0A1D2VA39_9ASCO|nr:acyl-CoA N-acyltransferase [Ascoidea rubescens DSM 1968]ODV58518.1 acyl-CoA N-acyltransferase [Ascoidea rubescens DSM 1968]
MTSINPFKATDLFDINPVNLDTLTENFPLYFYFQYLIEWPSLFFKSEEIFNDNERTISGYMMGKAEGSGMEWHSHITAVTVNPIYRRLSLASKLCVDLEDFTKSNPYNVYFIDLFVKVTNLLAQNLYEKLGYSVYRRVVGYYGSSVNDVKNRNDINDDIDAYDMRKSLPRDAKKQCVRENGKKHYVSPNEIEFK